MSGITNLGYLRDGLAAILTNSPVVRVFVFPGRVGQPQGFTSREIPSMPESLRGKVHLLCGLWEGSVTEPEYFGLVTEDADAIEVESALNALQVPHAVIRFPTVAHVQHVYEQLRDHPALLTERFILRGRMAPEGQMSSGAFQAMGYRF